MGKPKRKNKEQTMEAVREAKRLVNGGANISQACKAAGITSGSYKRWASMVRAAHTRNNVGNGHPAHTTHHRDAANVAASRPRVTETPLTYAVIFDAIQQDINAGRHGEAAKSLRLVADVLDITGVAVDEICNGH